jgi:hypothetical protein
VQDIDDKRDTYWRSQLDFSSQPDLHTAKQRLQNLHNYFVIGEDE